jgi:hypothetical protein
MDDKFYPGLYRAADNASVRAQSAYLWAVRFHILALLIGAGLTGNPIPSTLYSLVNAGVFLLALAISILIATKRYEKAWYSARAVAESVKTATWRFMMRADPFLDANTVKEVKAVFRNLLNEILSSNNQLGDLLGGDDCAHEQITEQMTEERNKTLEDRKSFYLAQRIDEQRTWYAKKSTYNKKRSGQFFALLVALQSFAVACVLLRITYPDWTIWPTDVFVVGAGAVVTWVQLQRFQELATAYALTAHEIGIIRGKLAEAESDEEFSDFVRDAENAFSREHTQWVAKVEG